MPWRQAHPGHSPAAGSNAAGSQKRTYREPSASRKSSGSSCNRSCLVLPRKAALRQPFPRGKKEAGPGFTVFSVLGDECSGKLGLLSRCLRAGSCFSSCYCRGPQQAHQVGARMRTGCLSRGSLREQRGSGRISCTHERCARSPAPSAQTHDSRRWSGAIYSPGRASHGSALPLQKAGRGRLQDRAVWAPKPRLMLAPFGIAISTDPKLLALTGRCQAPASARSSQNPPHPRQLCSTCRGRGTPSLQGSC